MKSPVSIVLVGIGGMGSVYLNALLKSRESGAFRIEGAVDPYPEKCPHLGELRTFNIPVFERLEEFYSEHRADLAIISSPIHFHCPQTCLALFHGSDVLCEKPVAATVQDARLMIKARDKEGGRVAIGYQWSFSTAIQDLKKDIRKGLFGRPRRLRCLYLWPRHEAYYRRNNWAGKQKDTEGRWILDSPAGNAMAHDLHNMFYILGEKTDSSALPVRVEAELYRAYEIENFDTAALRCFTDKGVEILFYASHATELDRGPVFSYEFEGGTVSMNGRDSEIRALFSNGEEKRYGNPDSEPLQKMWEAIESAVTKSSPVCGIEAAMSQTLCLDGAQDSVPEIVSFPRAMKSEQGEPGERKICVQGLAEAWTESYERSLLPSEMGVPWSKRGKAIDLTTYRGYPGG